MYLQDYINEIKLPDTAASNDCSKKWNELAHPAKSLGDLEFMVERLAAIYGTSSSEALSASNIKKAHILYAADHGIAIQGVSPFPQDITVKMVENFGRGGAAINVLTRAAGVELFLVDVGVKSSTEHVPGVNQRKVALGSGDISTGEAMTVKEMQEALEIGFDFATELIKKNRFNMISLGEMGIGNTSPSAAIIHVLTGERLDRVVGIGSGLDYLGVANKINIIRRGILLNFPQKDNPWEVLRRVGGLEIASMVGTIIACAYHGVPVFLDGLITAAAACVAKAVAPDTVNYMFATHSSTEPGYRTAMMYLRLEPFLTLKMRLGEGTGAILGMSMVDMALALYGEMATFDDINAGEAV